MAELKMRTMNGGGMTALKGPVVEELAAGLRGDLVTPASADYDETRAIWNAMFDRRPGLQACYRPAGPWRSLGHRPGERQFVGQPV